MQPQATALDGSRVLPHQTYPANTQVSSVAHPAQGKESSNQCCCGTFLKNMRDLKFNLSVVSLSLRLCFQVISK